MTKPLSIYRARSRMRQDAAIHQQTRRPKAFEAWDSVTTHAVELVFAAVVLRTFIFLSRTTKDAYFLGDDWGLIRQAGSLRGILNPYNDHLSVTILALYRALIEVFGFSYGPFRLAGIACLVGIPVAYFLTTRGRLGPLIAAIAALSLLGVGQLELYPAMLNHYLVLVAGIGCAAALNRGPRADWTVAAGLALALSAAGGGVAVAAACVVHSLCTRAPMRRWAAVMAPCIAWGCWWLVVARDAQSSLRPTVRPTLSEALRYAWAVLATPFEYLGQGNVILAMALCVAFGMYGWRELRLGLEAAANFLAWSAALGIWAIGLAYGRGSRALGVPLEPSQHVFFRYQLLALGFALLAIVPLRQIDRPVRLTIANKRRWLTVAAMIVLAFALTQSMRLRSDVEYRAAWYAGLGMHVKGELLILDLGPIVIPDDVRMRNLFVDLSAADVRSLAERYQGAPRSTSATVDKQVIDVGLVWTQSRAGRHLSCRPLTEPILWRQTADSPLSLWSDQSSWSIQVRRFGADWITLAIAEAGQKVAINLPRLLADEPWQVVATGACRVGQGV